MRRVVGRLRKRIRRGRGDRGVALIEMALVAPFLALLVAGIVEFGTLWRDDLTVTSATRSAARVVSNAGITEGADLEGILSLRAALKSIEGVTVEGLLIYNASASDGQPDSDCFDSGGNPRSRTNLCNFYTASQIETLTSSSFSACTGPDASFCPLNRDNTQLGGTTDLGVWVRVQRDFITGLIPGDGITITDYTVMKLEPET
jgi:TadE-like protein